MTKNEKFIKKWSKDREKGKGWYMITRSITLGISMWVGSTTGMLIRGNKFYFDSIYFIGGLIGGLIGSSIGWNKNEKKYADLINNTEID